MKKHIILLSALLLTGTVKAQSLFRGRRRFWKRLRDVPLMQQMYCWMKVENHAVTITWFRENGILMKRTMAYRTNYFGFAGCL